MPYGHTIVLYNASCSSIVVHHALQVDPCEDCGHDLMSHWTPRIHPCTEEDCFCPAWRDPERPPSNTTYFEFPKELR